MCMHNHTHESAHKYANTNTLTHALSTHVLEKQRLGAEGERGLVWTRLIWGCPYPQRLHLSIQYDSGALHFSPGYASPSVYLISIYSLCTRMDFTGTFSYTQWCSNSIHLITLTCSRLFPPDLLSSLSSPPSWFHICLSVCPCAFVCVCLCVLKWVQLALLIQTQVGYLQELRQPTSDCFLFPQQALIAYRSWRRGGTSISLEMNILPGQCHIFHIWIYE